jgi:hypothetical protein
MLFLYSTVQYRVPGNTCVGGVVVLQNCSKYRYNEEHAKESKEEEKETRKGLELSYERGQWNDLTNIMT